MKALTMILMLLGFALPATAMEGQEKIRMDFNTVISQADREEKDLAKNLNKLLDEAQDESIANFIREEVSWQDSQLAENN